MKKRFMILMVTALLLCAAILPVTAAGSEILPHKHILDEGTVVYPPTCTTGGEVLYACKDPDCSYTKSVFLRHQGHHMVKGEVVQEWGCTTAKVQRYYCIHEDFVKTVWIEPLGHWFRPAETVVEPTCTDPGVVMYRCFRDGCEESKKVTVNALGHDWSKSEITVQPGENTPGLRETVCPRCGRSVSKEVPALSTQFRVRVNNGPHYIVSPAGPQTIRADEEIHFTLTLEDGWERGDEFAVTADNAVITEENGSFTIHNVEANTLLSVTGIVPTDG